MNRHETSMINTVEQALAVLDGLPREGCGLALDTYHMNIDESAPAKAIRSAAASIWRPLASSPAALAIEGLSFLRGAAASIR